MELIWFVFKLQPLGGSGAPCDGWMWGSAVRPWHPSVLWLLFKCWLLKTGSEIFARSHCFVCSRLVVSHLRVPRTLEAPVHLQKPNNWEKLSGSTVLCYGSQALPKRSDEPAGTRGNELSSRCQNGGKMWKENLDLGKQRKRGLLRKGQQQGERNWLVQGDGGKARQAAGWESQQWVRGRESRWRGCAGIKVQEGAPLLGPGLPGRRR